MKLYQNMQPIEVAIVSAVCSMLRERGYQPFTANDGGDTDALIGDGSLDTILEVVNSVEISSIRFRGPRGGVFAVQFVLGNGADIVSDWSGEVTFGEIVDTALSLFGESRNLHDWGFWVRWDQGDGPLVPNMPEVYSKRVDHNGYIHGLEVTIKPWMGEDDTTLEFARWVDSFIHDLNYHPARAEA